VSRPPQLVALVLVLIAGAARGDGGLLRINQVAGPLRIAVFTAPTPLRSGPIDVSVLVQRAADDAPILDADVTVTLHRGDLAVRAAATRAQATNKLLYEALLQIPESGEWTLHVAVRAGESEGAVSTAVDVALPIGPAWTYWPYLALPAVLIALFAVHQWLRTKVPPP
jgi:hypothetical protein